MRVVSDGTDNFLHRIKYNITSIIAGNIYKFSHCKDEFKKVILNRRAMKKNGKNFFRHPCLTKVVLHSFPTARQAYSD